MDPLQILIDQLASYVCSQAARLDELRLEMFMMWLKSHSSAVRNATSADPNHTRIQVKKETCGLKDSLKLWFKVLPVSGLIWEYRLILTEISWWHALDERSLARILKEDLEG